jgi:dolichyl-phosphate beta-glucosyltransferase
MSDIALTLILPTYNAAPFLDSSLEQAYAFLKTIPLQWEWLIIDDGSRDSSPRICDSFCERAADSRIRVIKCDRNGGKGSAVRRGIGEARGRYVVFTDCDLAYPIEEITKIYTALEQGADVAIACRVHRESRFIMSPAFFRYLYTRHFMGRVFNFLVRHWLLPNVWDTQAGLKGFRQEAARAVFSLQRFFRFSFDVEILYIARRAGYSLAQIPVNFRYFEEPTTVRFLQDTVRMLRDLARMKWNGMTGLYDPQPETSVRLRNVAAVDLPASQ